MNNLLATAPPAAANAPGTPARAPVIFLDDDADLRRANEQSLLLHGFDVRACASAREALATLTERYEGVVVADVRMPDIDGFQLFHRIRAIDADIPVILITGHGDIDMAVQAIREGVYDFVAKPYPLDRLIQAITHAGEKRRLILENRSLRVAAEGAADNGFHFIGTTPAMQRIKQTLRHIADADVDVLIQGETGSGKEVAAQALHRSSRRRDKPFVAINCGALPESIIESELFGHEAGAFTGAQKRRIGRIEHSHGGTLFLDEIESMPLAVQVKLLRVLETRQVAPLGTNDVRDVDLRVIAATKEDLAAPALRSRFREDLYYRLNVVTLHLPPLRERAADIPLLFAHHVAQASQRFHRAAPPVTAQVRRYLAQHAWPGNVRELAHFAERFVLDVLDAEITEAPGAGDFSSLPLQLEKHEEKLIREALAATQGDVRQTLEILGIPRKTFYDKLQRHGIDRASYSV